MIHQYKFAKLDLINKKDITTIKEMIKSDKIQTRLPYILNLE